MGSRANLLLVKSGNYRLFYNHWCAGTLPCDMFWGPEHAERFIAMQREIDRADEASQWLDDRWAEGGVVMDCDARLLLFFGGEDLRYEIPLRRVYLNLMAQVWVGWQLQWAHEGIVEMARHVRYPVERVLSEQTLSVPRALQPIGPRKWFLGMATLKTGRGMLNIYPLDPRGSLDHLRRGPPIIEELQALIAHETFNWEISAEAGSFPFRGFHIDVAARTVDFWSGRDEPRLLLDITPVWPDWTLRWHRDSFESQLQLAEGQLRFPEQPREELMARLKAMLLRPEGSSMALEVTEIFQKIAREGEKVEVNPSALEDARRELSMEVKHGIFDAAVARLARER